MEHQPELGLVMTTHPETSWAAARGNRRVLRERVYRYIHQKDGATDDELIVVGERAGYTANGIRPRRIELVRAGRVHDSGRRRPTRTGRMAIVWVTS